MLAPVRILARAVVLVIAGCSVLAGCSSSPAAVPAVTGPAADTSAMSMPAGQPTGATTTGGPASHLVDPAEFASAIATRGTVTIDVHVPFEGKIAGTDLMIPYTDIDAQAVKLPADHHTELAIYCRTGVMSAIAAKSLAALGYTDVVELHGGMYAWEASGRTLLGTP